ncbi:MAG: hypothetical protein JWO38_1347 [Gemmataceae bacterium]|nr:hypothetical protein [Gemmataceae bacterium]
MTADVRSIDAVRDWHAALTTYGETLDEAVAGVELEIRRAFDWLSDQVGLWQRAVRECEDEVVRAKAELSARKFPDFSGRMPDTTVQEKALRLAKARLEHAEDQVVRVRAWIGRLPKVIDEVYRGAVHRLVSFLEAELPKGLAVLDRRIGSLESYAGLRPDYAPGPSSAPGEPTLPSPTPSQQGREDKAPPASGEGTGTTPPTPEPRP